MFENLFKEKIAIMPEEKPKELFAGLFVEKEPQLGGEFKLSEMQDLGLPPIGGMRTTTPFFPPQKTYPGEVLLKAETFPGAVEKIVEGVKLPPTFGEKVEKVALGIESIMQSINRNIASAGLTFARGEELKIEDFPESFQFIARGLFGEEETIKPIEQRIAEAEPKFKEWGEKTKAMAADSKLKWVGGLVSKYPEWFAGPIIFSSIGIDLTPFGGLEKGVYRAMTKAKTIGEATSVLSKMGVADDLIKQFAPEVIKVADEKSAKTLFTHIAEVQKTTKVVPEAISIAQKAIKGAIPPQKGIIPQELQQGVKEIVPISKEELSKAKNIITENTPEQISGGGIFEYTENAVKYNRQTRTFEKLPPKKIQTYRQTPFDGVPEDILAKIKQGGGALPKGVRGGPYQSNLSIDDLRRLGRALTENGYAENTGMVVKGYGGNDVILGTTKIDGQMEYIVAEIKNGKLLNIRLHGTPIENNQIIGRITNIFPEFTKLGAPEIKPITQAVKGVKEVGIKEGIIATAPKTLPKQIGKETIEQVFNVEKLNLGPEQIANIEKRLDALGLKTRTIRTFDDMKRAAQELGVDTRRLLTETTQSIITDKEVVALKNTINTLADDIVKQEKNIILNPKQEQILNIKLRQSEQAMDMALQKLIKGGTEAGRTVTAFRIIAEKTLEPTFWLKKAKTIAGGRKLTSDEVIAITNLIKNGDRQGLANFVSMLRNPSFAEMAVALWKAGLLTSPTTHLANIGGNLTMAGLMTASDVFSTGFDVLASLITGKRTTTIGFSTIAAKVKGFVSGTKAAGRYLTKGIYSADVLKKWDMPRQTVFKNKILNGYVQSVFRSLGAEDILFRQAAMAESFKKSAIVMAKNEKLSGQVFKARVKELLADPTNEMVMNAIDAAEYATFQSPNALANFIRAGKAAGGEALRTTTEFVAPFTLTPTNIAARIMDFTPAGFVKAIIQGIRPATRSQKAIVESLGRATTGTGIMTLGAYLASKGLMSGNAPEDVNERSMFFAEGKQANSLQIGNYNFQLNRISPIGNLMALGAEFNQLSKEQEGAQLIGATALAGVKGLTEQTFLQGISSALKVINEPERQFERYVQRGVAGFVPSIIGRTARTIDPKLRIPNSVFEAVEERIPFLRKEVAPRRDIFGNIAPVPGGSFNLFDPFAITKVKDDPVINEAKKIGAVIGMPSQTISGAKLDQHEYSVYQKVQGRILHQTLSALINSPDYQQLSITDKDKAFSSHTRSVRTQLNDMLFPALMIKRFNLPNETNPQILRDLLGELFQNDKFKESSEEKQSNIIKKLLEKYAE